MDTPLLDGIPKTARIPPLLRNSMLKTYGAIARRLKPIKPTLNTITGHTNHGKLKVALGDEMKLFDKGKLWRRLARLGKGSADEYKALHGLTWL
jgi:hypothetical protein